MALSERRRAILLTAIVVITAASLMLTAQALQLRPPAPSSGIPVSLLIQSPDWTISYRVNATLNNTVFLFLLEAARTLHFTLEWDNYSPPLSAVFVTSINGVRNGADNRYWLFWINGAYGTTAADLAVLRGGETILWKFDVTQEG